jgi:hypothetical protein
MRRATVLFLVTLVAACGGGSGGDPDPVVQGVALLLAAGMVPIEPAPVDDVSPGVDLGRLDISDVTQVYDLTTPAGEPFSFDLLSRNDGNVGPVRVSVAHAADDGVAPSGGPETLVPAGIVPTANGAGSHEEWLDAFGDGFARITLNGSIDRDQVIAVEAATGEGTTTALVRVRVGPPSPINVPPQNTTDYPGVLSLSTIYSSDSYQFGLPTCAVSGDRTTAVVYEGDRSDPFAYDRYELRLQHDALTGLVTGGAAPEPSPDVGNWRDHEVAALFNVLALVHCGWSEVTLRLSFDRGATFGQNVVLARAGSEGATRLATLEMAADYTLAVAFWQSHPGGTELVLVEASPSAFDGNGSPTRFTLGAPQVLYRSAKDLVPVIMGLAWSAGGDLVLGYGFTEFEWNEATMESIVTTQFRCAVRSFGGEFRDTLLEEDVTVARDPSVAVLGQGPTMKVFYAYEGREGVRMRTSADAGVTWSAPMVLGDPFSYMPSVFARPEGSAERVDLLYLTYGGAGTELHLRHWDDFATAPFADYRLTESRMEGDLNDPFPGPMPGPMIGGGFAPVGGPKITQVSWFGYDATLDGDDLVVVFDEETSEAFAVMALDDGVRGAEGGGAGAPAAGDAEFRPADPPPLAPGLSEPVPPPDPADRHQLRLMRLRSLAHTR